VSDDDLKKTHVQNTVSPCADFTYYKAMFRFEMKIFCMSH
jgi:hypothetical protein